MDAVRPARAAIADDTTVRFCVNDREVPIDLPYDAEDEVFEFDLAAVLQQLPACGEGDVLTLTVLRNDVALYEQEIPLDGVTG